MVDKKIVDDYYSQINVSNSDQKKVNSEKKTKIVPKKKIIIKKAWAVNSQAISSENKNEWDSKPQNKVQVNKQVKKTIVQKIEVVKRADKKQIEVIKRADQVPKKDFQERWNKKSYSKSDDNKSFTKVNENKSFSSNDSKTDFSKKVFTDNKKPLKGSNFKKSSDEENSKKPKINFHKKTRWKVRFWIDEEVSFTRSNKIQKIKKEEKKLEDIKQTLVAKKGETITLTDFLSIKELSEKFWVTLPLLIAEFMKNWIMVNINSKVDFDTASIIWEAFEIKTIRDNSWWASVEDIVLWDISYFLQEDDSSNFQPRSPVVSIMWHVDHWKTSLLDYIRKAKVASWESGWITQSIWAYQVELEQWNITFLDTPWHEAFTVMRARWAKSTDIAILVVAADEWVKPQTIESISHAKEADIPVIVAINKMDKEWANPDHVKWQLAENWLLAEDWGWDIPMVPVSAHSWFWIDDLLEIILLVSEMKELKANPNRNWVATVIESHLDSNLWPVATVLINTWTINSWDNIVCQDSYGKVKILRNYNNQKVKFAKPGDPVLIVWLDKVVDWWDILQVVNSSDIAKNKAIEYKTILEKQKMVSASWLDLLMMKIKAWNLKQLKIILKADTNWSLEAIKTSLIKLSTPETTVSIILAWVWSITESDILMWKWSEAILVWYNVWVLSTAKSTLESAWVEYISSDIIYQITERVEKIVTWMLDPKEVEVVLWRSRVWWIFFTDKKFKILWLIVSPEAKVENNTSVRILRKKKLIWLWKIESLKQWTLEVKEVEGPIECWIKLVTSVDIEIWDDLEVYKTEIQK